MKKKSDMLNIAVTFPRPSDRIGPTGYQTRMSANVVSSFIPDEVTRGKALDELQKRGFSVSGHGRLTVSIRGSKADFEKHFGTTLTQIDLPSDKMTKYSADSVLFPEKNAPWSPVKKLAKLIDDAYIQWPHIYMNQRFSEGPPSPIPPQVNYHALTPPGDLAILLNASRVHREGCTGKGIRVAMIDSGFAHGHSYFQEMGYNSSVVLAPGATYKEKDGNGHGTGESANIFAMSPDVIFTGIKLDNEDDSRGSASILEGFQEALDHNPHIISVSLGYDLCVRDRDRTHYTTLPNSMKALEAEIAQAVADGIVVVFSAGNGHVAFPGMMSEVISAGGVYVGETGKMMASDYASAFVSKIYHGRGVPDFCGLVGLAKNNADYIKLPIPPGCEIDRSNSKHDGTLQGDGWGVFSGTSAAAPQLAGVCALLLEKNPRLTPSDVKSVLRASCRDVADGSASKMSNQMVAMKARPGIDGATGAGLVNVFAAWKQV